MNLAADDPEAQARIGAFLQGLQQLGWTDGRNVRIDYRWGAGDAGRYRRYAAELVALAPDVILAVAGRPWSHCNRRPAPCRSCSWAISDPVGVGFVASLARPGGNITGFAFSEYGTSAKWLELLKQIAPARDACGGPSGSQPGHRDRPIGRHPGRGAVARGGVEPGRRARRRRNRARQSPHSRAGRMAA